MFALGLAASTAPLAAQTHAPNGSARAATPAPIQDVLLPNGLRVLMQQDHSAPVVAVVVVYNVGSRNEQFGHTGFAHLFEHMMFQGSANVGKGEHIQLVQENGGAMNGETSNDFTTYYELLPANQLPLALFLEGDRMKSLAVNQANLDNQRAAVQEERRLRMDNQPYGKTPEVLESMVYDNFAYKHDTIGSMDDLNAATVDDVKKFFSMYYAPNNATLAIVGDFDAVAALAEVKKYFAGIASQPTPPAVDATEPRQTGERRRTITDNFARLPMLSIGWKTVQEDTIDFRALDMFLSILCDGKSSRLYQRLVKQDKLAVQENGRIDPSRGTALAEITVITSSLPQLSAAEAAVYEEIQKLIDRGPEPWEMEKVRNELKASVVARNASDLGRAMTFAQDAIEFNQPDRLYREMAFYDAITPGQVRDAARQYLTAANRSVLLTLPKPASETPEVR